MPVNAFTATAVSMLNNGDSLEHVRETLGLSEAELADALQHAKIAEAVQNIGLSASEADSEDSSGTPESAAPAPDSTMDAHGIEALLAWAENHPAASIRTRAARVRSGLAELTERRAAEDAQREAEERVAKAKAELEAAQARLREVKTGGRTALNGKDATLLANVPATTPDATGKRSSEQLAEIRAWARANGYQVADRGTPAKAVLDAYDAAHRTSNLAEAS